MFIGPRRSPHAAELFSGGADWHCTRCGQRWDALRLATVAAYAVWLAEHTAASIITHQPIMKADDVLIVQEPSV